MRVLWDLHRHFKGTQRVLGRFPRGFNGLQVFQGFQRGFTLVGFSEVLSVTLKGIRRGFHGAFKYISGEFLGIFRSFFEGSRFFFQ